MKIPFLDLKTQYLSIKDEVDSAIQKVLDNTAFILGPSVENFEKDFAAAQQVKYCAGTSSHTIFNLPRSKLNIVWELVPAQMLII